MKAGLVLSHQTLIGCTVLFKSYASTLCLSVLGCTMGMLIALSELLGKWTISVHVKLAEQSLTQG